MAMVRTHANIFHLNTELCKIICHKILLNIYDLTLGLILCALILMILADIYIAAYMPRDIHTAGKAG